MVAEVRKERRGGKKKVINKLHIFFVWASQVSSQQLYIISPRPGAITGLLASLLPSTSPGICVDTTSRAVSEHNLLLTSSLLFTAATHLYRIDLQMDCTGFGWSPYPNTSLDFTSKYTWRPRRPATAKDHTTQDDDNPSTELGPSHHGGGKHRLDHKQSWTSAVQGEKLPKSCEHYSITSKCPRAWPMALLPPLCLTEAV